MAIAGISLTRIGNKIIREKPVRTVSIGYNRLHGLNEDRYDYDYDYSKEELKKLAEKMENLEEDLEHIYVMFNNFEMYQNAEKLRQILGVKLS